MLVAVWLVQALVIEHLWGWFITPTFHTVFLSFPVALGIVWIKDLLLIDVKKDDYDQESGICAVVLLFVLGWLVNTFFM